MGMFHSVKVGDTFINQIDWDMKPELTFGTFESWGGRERVRNNNECVYYFFVDSWGDEPKLCLMERAVKHARVLAEIKAPRDLVETCVAEQGWAARFEQTFAINKPIREWLINNVLDEGDSSLIVPVVEESEYEDMGPPLPSGTIGVVSEKVFTLPTESKHIQEEELPALLQSYNFYDSLYNPQGSFTNALVDSGDDSTVLDLKTGLMWQRGGLDINSIRQITRSIEQLNDQGFAGYHDWRMPTIEEAMSLMESQVNEKGVFLNPCFSKNQPFIFVAAKRKPGGYWFADYKQGRLFWSSGTIPGGFARLVRSHGK